MTLAIARRAAFLGGLAALTPAAFIACSDGTDGAAPEASADASLDSSALDASAQDSYADVTVDDAGSCSEGGFCREPLPVHQPLVAVTAASADDVWAVGGNVMLRWNGTSWKTVYQYGGTSEAFELLGVWGTKSDDIWALAVADAKAFLIRHASADGGPAAFREILTEEELSPYDQNQGWLAPSGDELWIFRRYAGQLRRMRELPDGSVVVDDVMPPVLAADPEVYFEWESLGGFASNDVWVGGHQCLNIFCGEERGALAHYDGATWSITILDTSERVSTIVGTTDPDQPRRLWLGLGHEVALVPVEANGGVGAPLHTQTVLPDNYDCSHLVGAAISPALAWLSNGCLVYRWNGTALDVMPVSPNGIPSAYVKGIWAGKSGDAWIVGESLIRGPNAPKTGFTARRKGDAP